MKKLLVLIASMALTTVAMVRPAYAIFGVGDIVIDPSNLVQNILTAGRTLLMVNNQIKQLENETQMLVNSAKNLESLDLDTLDRLRVTLATTERLFDEAEGLAYELIRARDTFARLYPAEYEEAVSSGQLNQDRHERWALSRDALGTSLAMQAQAKQNFEEDKAVLADLIHGSQAAVGQLQAAQATNQLLALQARQLMQAQQLQITQDRATALEQARTVAAEERARAVRRQFMSVQTTYTPESVRGL